MNDGPARATPERDEWLAESARANARFLAGILKYGFLLGFPLFLFFCALGPVAPGNKWAPQSALLQQVHQIGMALRYAGENRTGNSGPLYPEAMSSTEVFQKLLDQGHATDPTIFYVAMPGKVKPIAGQKLKPENVSFDFTAGIAPGDSPSVPMVFLTGYRVTYAPGTAAVPLIKPFPRFGYARPAWWLLGMKYVHWENSGGEAVFYSGNNAAFLNAEGGSIPHFVPAAFDAQGKTYRQLTPDGVLPP